MGCWLKHGHSLGINTTEHCDILISMCVLVTNESNMCSVLIVSLPDFTFWSAAENCVRGFSVFIPSSVVDKVSLT